MSGSLTHGSHAEPNLTPILDMVFQLITFFMLVINFKAIALDLTVHLPVVGSAAPVASGRRDLLVLNVDAAGRLRVCGEHKNDIEGYLRSEALASLFRARVARPQLKVGDDLPDSIVVVRADRRTPFQLLNRVLKAAQDAGYRNFSLKAMNRDA